MAAKGKRLLTAAGVMVFWLAVWWLLSRAVAQELLLPTPARVIATLLEMWQTAAFWRSVAFSLLRVLAGFAAAVAVGSALALLTTRFSLLHTLFAPLLHIVRAAPVASFIILAYVWIRVQILPSFISFLMVVPLVWSNMCQGIRQTDRQLLEMARVFRLGRWRTLRWIWLPSIGPFFRVACTTGLGFAWKSGIAAEVICMPMNSIGKQLHTAKAYLETPEVFAWTVTVVLLSIFLERLLLWSMKRSRTV